MISHAMIVGALMLVAPQQVPSASAACTDYSRCPDGCPEYLAVHYDPNREHQSRGVAQRPAAGHDAVQHSLGYVDGTAESVWEAYTDMVAAATCYPSSEAEPELIEIGELTYYNQKIRYLSFHAGDPAGTRVGGRIQAVRVTFVDLPAPYDMWNGVKMWVQEPERFCENSGIRTPPCPDAVPRNDWLGATLGCNPWFGDFYSMTHDSEGVNDEAVHVYHEGIIPGGAYAVQVIDSTCDTGQEGDYSASLNATTSAWGDLVRDCTTCPCGPPNGAADVPNDVRAVSDKAVNLAPPYLPCPAVVKARADLEPVRPDQLINLSDVAHTLGAFRGFAYPPPSFPPPSPPPCAGPLPVCGNAIVEADEQCDDGNLIPGDGCDQNCRSELCGNGAIDFAEECDDGAGNSDTTPDACRTDCTLPRCGDSVVDSGEQCDDGNTSPGDRCDQNCQIEAFVGNAVISLVPVSSSDPGATIVEGENKIYVSTGGHQVFLNIRVSDWDPSATAQTVITFQVGIDSTGYTTGVQGVLSPWQPSCTKDADCEALMGPLGTWPYDLTRGGCGVYGVPPGVCAAGFIDDTRTDRIAGWMDRSTMDYRYGGWGVTAPSPGYDAYAGTLAVDVPPNAAGTFTIDFKHETGHTYMIDHNTYHLIPLGGIQPALITVLTPCCLPNGSCLMTDPETNECADLGGDPQGPGSDCDTTVCQAPKWAQPPIFKPGSAHPKCYWGWDELSDYDVGPIVADDWACMDDRAVTGVHWWGSYIGWSGEEPPEVTPDSFHIGIWTDVPFDPGQPDSFSHPGTMIWDWTVEYANLNERTVGCDFHPDFMDVPEVCFRYDFTIPEVEWFRQQPACSIYWLSIAADYDGDPGPHPWGWKTREHHFNDDAVKILSPLTPVVGSAYEEGLPIEHPAGLSWDMAFVLTSCPLADAPTPPAGEPGYTKMRNISMVPGNPGRLTALRVTLTNLPEYSEFNGTQCWVGPPDTYCENAGVVTPPCPPATPTTDYVSARLQGTPHCMDWSTVGAIHVTDDEIVPPAVYDVQAVDCECDLGNEAYYSAPLTIATSRYGDLVGTCAATPCTPPDGTVGIPSDVTAVLDKFKNLAGVVMKARADVDWEVPNRRIDISDVTFVLDAFRGCTYSRTPPFPFCYIWRAPDGCP